MNDSIRFGALPLMGRVLLVLEFLIGANGKISDWSGQAAYMQSHGMKLIQPLLGAALLIELVGSLCVLLGFRARTAAAVMFVYLGVVSIQLHDFWNQTGNSAGMGMTQFFKNLGMMGGLLLLAAYGPGRWALSRERMEAAHH